MSANRISHLLPESIQAELQDPEKMAEFQKGQDFLKAVLTRSTTDEGFRTQLLEEPRTAIAGYYAELHGDGGNIGQIDVHFVENKGDLTLVLPPFVDTSGELSEAELQTVAGGEGISAAIASLIVASNLGCLGFAAGVATVVAVTWALSD